MTRVSQLGSFTLMIRMPVVESTERASRTPRANGKALWDTAPCLVAMGVMLYWLRPGIVGVSPLDAGEAAGDGEAAAGGLAGAERPGIALGAAALAPAAGAGVVEVGTGRTGCGTGVGSGATVSVPPVGMGGGGATGTVDSKGGVTTALRG
jgi:hypothetical protein